MIRVLYTISLDVVNQNLDNLETVVSIDIKISYVSINDQFSSRTVTANHFTATVIVKKCTRNKIKAPIWSTTTISEKTRSRWAFLIKINGQLKARVRERRSPTV